MSNCVVIDNPAVLFRNSEFDVPRFVNLMSSPEVTGDKQPAWGGEPGYNEDVYVAWWFLHGAWRMDEGGKGIWISFGCGRSTHTWRDLKGTIQWLRKFILLPKSKVFVARDESDGMRKRFRLEVDFWNNTVKG